MNEVGLLKPTLKPNFQNLATFLNCGVFQKFDLLPETWFIGAILFAKVYFSFIGCFFSFPVSPRFDADHPTVVYSWAGKTKNISCVALGEPEPYIRWYRKNEWIDQKNETFRDFSKGRHGILQVGDDILAVCHFVSQPMGF